MKPLLADWGRLLRLGARPSCRLEQWHGRRRCYPYLRKQYVSLPCPVLRRRGDIQKGMQCCLPSRTVNASATEILIYLRSILNTAPFENSPEQSVLSLRGRVPVEVLGITPCRRMIGIGGEQALHAR